MPGTFSPAFFLSRKTMREPSIFVDEPESDDLSDRHYLLTVVMHDQSDSIAESIKAYEDALRAGSRGPRRARSRTGSARRARRCCSPRPGWQLDPLHFVRQFGEEPRNRSKKARQWRIPTIPGSSRRSSGGRSCSSTSQASPGAS